MKGTLSAGIMEPRMRGGQCRTHHEGLDCRESFISAVRPSLRLGWGGGYYTDDLRVCQDGWGELDVGGCLNAM